MDGVVDLALGDGGGLRDLGDGGLAGGARGLEVVDGGAPVRGGGAERTTRNVDDCRPALKTRPPQKSSKTANVAPGL